jgi:hypothetical protein
MALKITLPARERIALSYKQLAVASKDLNTSADALNKSITQLETALKPLNLGVSAWHKVAAHQDDDGGSYWTRDVGYTRVADKWRIALRKTWGHNGYDHHGEEVWAFADAPRWMCVESVSKIPDLLDALVARTNETAAQIKKRTAETDEFVTAIAEVSTEVTKNTSGNGKG